MTRAVTLFTILLILAILVFVALTSPCHALDKMTKGERLSEVAYLLLQWQDWRQTRYITDHPDEYYERNWILGDHPSVEEVDRYHLIAAVSHIAITKLLPHKWRKVWLSWTIAIEVYAVGNNLSIGIGWRW